MPIFPNCLWSSTTNLPLGAHGVVMYPLQLLMGNLSLATLLAIPPQVSTATEGPTPTISHPTTLVASMPSPGMKQQCHSPNWVACSPQPGDKATETSGELPHQKWKDMIPLKILLKGGWQEAFAKDLDLVQGAREAYFRTNCPHFDCKFSCDLSCTFWEMADSAGLLESGIYEVQDTGTGWKDLRCTNHAAKASQKNIQFFHVVTPTKLRSVMGLEGIHSLEALHR